jgi:hypothetical protein
MATGDLISAETEYLNSAVIMSIANLAYDKYYIVYGPMIKVVIGSTIFNAQVVIAQRQGSSWVTLLSYVGTAGGTYYYYKGSASTNYPVWLICKIAMYLGEASVTVYAGGYGYSGMKIHSVSIGQNSGNPFSSVPTASSYNGGYPSYLSGESITWARRYYLCTYT